MIGSRTQQSAPRLRFHADGATHSGTRRLHNEDRLVLDVDRGVWAVADGVGGLSNGEQASELVASRIQAVPAILPLAERRLAVIAALTAAHQELLDGAKRQGKSVAPSTTVVVLLAEESRYICIWAGDSRAYHLRQGVLRQLTRDHSLVQELVDMRALSREQAERHPNAHVITRAIGQDGPLELDETKGMLEPGDDLLLCSDGLFKALDDDTMIRLLTEGRPAAQQLLLAALAADATDNVTAVTIHCREAELKDAN